MKVAIRLMTMYSDPGYVTSSGYKEAYLLTKEQVVECMGDEMALWKKARAIGKEITENDLEDIKESETKHSVLNYHRIEGTFEVPQGFCAVQVYHVDICTEQGVRQSAWIVEPSSLKELYLERAKKYQELADKL
jgi:hypothetical protein